MFANIHRIPDMLFSYFVNQDSAQWFLNPETTVPRMSDNDILYRSIILLYERDPNFEYNCRQTLFSGYTRITPSSNRKDILYAVKHIVSGTYGIARLTRILLLGEEQTKYKYVKSA